MPRVYPVYTITQNYVGEEGLIHYTQTDGTVYRPYFKSRARALCSGLLFSILFMMFGCAWMCELMIVAKDPEMQDLSDAGIAFGMSFWMFTNILFCGAPAFISFAMGCCGRGCCTDDGFLC